MKKAQGSLPTMSDVARIAGVSAMTVSRAFSEPGIVNQGTREKIEHAARQVGYLPNRVANALKSGVSNTVAAIIPSLRNGLFSEMLQGLADGLEDSGMVLTVGNAHYSQDEELRIISEFLSLRPRGIVLHETAHGAQTRRLLQASKVPTIEVGDLPRDPIDVAVSFSNARAARVLTEHLIARGRRRIVFLTIPIHLSRYMGVRLTAYRSALRKAGIAFDPALVIEASSGYEGGAQACARLLESGVAFDAILGAADIFALGALFELKRRRIRVPDDVAVANFLEHELCRVCDPAVTSLSIPRYEIGRRCAEIIVARARAASPALAQVHDMGFSLNIRESTQGGGQSEAV